MIELDEAKNDGDALPNKCRCRLYPQMALIINDGLLGRGKRWKILECVLNGVQDLFPDPQALYMSHREMESGTGVE